MWWTGRVSNPRPLRCQRNALPLSYQPVISFRLDADCPAMSEVCLVKKFICPLAQFQRFLQKLGFLIFHSFSPEVGGVGKDSNLRPTD